MVQLLVDGSDDFSGGQNAALIPDRIAPNEYAAGINVSVRRASIQPRWGFERSSLSFQDEYELDSFKKRRSYQNIFEGGKFQAMIPISVAGISYLIVIVSGRISAININDFSVTRIPIADGSTLNPRRARVNWTLADKYIVLYDFPSLPVILDGLSARRANPKNMEVPAAVNGAYNQNRLFVVNNGSEFTGGDPLGNLATPDAPITFEEVLTPGSVYFGQIFNLPSNTTNDPITFMGFLQITDVSTGIGPLICATKNAIYTYGTQNPRAAWENGPFGTVLCYNAGIVGQRAYCNVNSDAFFVAADGYVRSLAMSRDEQKRWARVPVSRECENWFKYWDKDLIQYAFVGYFRNKIFFSVNPYRVRALDFDTRYPISDCAHGGMAIIELDSLTSFGEPAKPIWTGLWTGVNPMDMTVIDERAFVMSKDGAINKLYEINPDINYDTADDVIRPVRSRIYTREYDFKDPFLNKGLHSIDTNFDTIKGDFKYKIEYKPSHSACFVPFGERTHTAPWRTCDIPEGCFFNGFAGQHIRDFSMGDPENDQLGSAVTNDLFRVFKKIQLMLTLVGIYWEVHEIRIKSTPELEPDTLARCEEYPPVAVCDCSCPDDWYVEEFGGCGELET